MAAILNSAYLGFSHLHKLHSCYSHSNSWWQPSKILLTQLWLKKKSSLCSIWLNLMMAAILNSAMLDSDTAILDSDTLLSSLRFNQKHSPSTLTKKLKLIQSDKINDGNHLDFFHLEFCHLGFSHFAQNSEQTSSNWLKLIHSHSTWWYQPSWILPCWIQTLPSWIQTPCYLLSDSLKNTLLHSDTDSN